MTSNNTKGPDVTAVALFARTKYRIAFAVHAMSDFADVLLMPCQWEARCEAWILKAIG